MNRKDAKSRQSENRVLRTSISVLFLEPNGEPMGPLTQWCIAKNGGGYTQRGVGEGPEGTLLIYDH